MMPRSVRIRSLALAMGAWAASAAPGEAQMLEGRLLSMDRDRPIPFGVVQLLSADGHEVARATARADGRFTLEAPEAGSYLVRGEAAFHEVWVEGPVTLADGQTLTVEFRLPQRPIALAPVEVTAPARLRNVQGSGFYDRAELGFGRFITAEEIDLRQPFRTSQLLRGTSRVRIRHVPGGETVVLFRQPPTFRNPSGICRPRVFLDGIPNAEFDLDGIVPEDIGGMEVYTSAAWVPPEFGGGLDGCGVILIWTRR